MAPLPVTLGFAPALDARPQLEGSPPRLLIVDDEEVLRELLQELFQSSGYEVMTSRDGQEALELVRQHSFSVILSDNHMPRMNGLDFFAKAQLIQPHATRILITGIVNLETVLECINRGEIYRFVIKPWVREELLATVKNGLHRYQLLVQNERLTTQTQQLNQQLSAANLSLEKQLQRELEQNRQLETLNRTLNQNLHRSVELCVKVLQTFYPSLGSHGRRVRLMCEKMAATLQLGAEERLTLDIAAQLHDIGLLGIPRDLIKKFHRFPSSLSEAERTLLRQHPVWGQELVGFIDKLSDVGKLIRSHHERFDGQGYPDQIAGSEIPWLARLLTAAITYVDIGKNEAETLTELKRLAGNALDPEAVRALLRAGPGDFVSRGQREVLLNELTPGMVLARGIYTANGMLLIPEGQKLSDIFISKLLSHHQVNPIKNTLLVYC